MTQNELFAISNAYITLLEIGDFPNRHTPEGQRMLAGLREMIAREWGVDGEKVQGIFERRARYLREIADSVPL